MEQKKQKSKKSLLKNSFLTNISIVISALVLLAGSHIFNISWFAQIAGVILVVQSALNIFSLLREITEEEIERQARMLARMFIKMQLDKYTKENSSEVKKKLKRLLKEDNKH